MNQEDLYTTLVCPLMTDKAYRSADGSNQVVFKVSKTATKLHIKKAVEKMFEVKVHSVNVLNQKGVTKRFGKTTGRTKDWKKAYVRLMPGEDISFIEDL